MFCYVVMFCGTKKPNQAGDNMLMTMKWIRKHSLPKSTQFVITDHPVTALILLYVLLNGFFMNIIPSMGCLTCVYI